MRTVDDVIRTMRTEPADELEAPFYAGQKDDDGTDVMLAVESMVDHSTDEGWQIALGLQHAGYKLAGNPYLKPTKLDLPFVNLESILEAAGRIRTMAVQDKIEWDARGDFRDQQARFINLHRIRDDASIFKVLVRKDAHSLMRLSVDAAKEMSAHAWIVYYHPRIVKHLAPYIRSQHMVRTWHSLEPTVVPPFSPFVMGSRFQRDGCLLSGAVSNAYPLRAEMWRNARSLHKMETLGHPGYHRHRCHTPEYMRILSRFKVSICTSSMYGFALRKIMESTACGCIVVTDLPSDEVLPEIDGNLVRVDSKLDVRKMNDLLKSLCDGWNSERQHEFAERAKRFYDWRNVGMMLARDIENMRRACCG